MTISLSPKDFNLPPKTVIMQLDEETIALVMDRKSRIIMVDGRKIVQKAEKIKAILPDVNVVLETNAPVCSKTKAFMEENHITIVSR